MRRTTFTFALALLASTVSAHAEQLVMLPFEPSAILGAGGVRWRTFLIAVNGSDQTVELGCPNGNCDRVPPHSHFTFEGPLPEARPAFLYLADAQAETVQLALRVYSDQAGLSRVMEVPIVKASDFRPDQLSILFVPLGNGARQSLRIYDREGRDGTEVRLRVYSAGDLQLDTVVTLRAITGAAGGKALRPAVYEVNDLASAFALATDWPVDVVVTPMTPDAHVWAFVTSTDNATHQFNNFLPQ